MNVKVMYKDGTFDIVRGFRLDMFLAEDKIEKFYRNSEQRWVIIGTDTVRKKDAVAGAYTGIERRFKDSI